MTPAERQAADDAFNSFLARVSALEATLEKYQEALNFVRTNLDPFLSNLSVRLEERFVNIESKVATLSSLKNPIGREELTHTLATYRDTMLASVKTLIDVSPAKSSISSNPKFEASVVFSGKRED